MQHRQRRCFSQVARALLLSGSLLFLSCCANHDASAPKQAQAILPAEKAGKQYVLDKQWWQSYKDPYLDKLVAEVLTQNVDLGKSIVALQKAGYQAKLAGAELIPTFSADTSADSSRDLKSGDSGESYQSGLSLAYEIDLWQRLRHATSALEWEHTATAADAEAVRLSLINSTVDTYFQLRYLHQAIVITTGNVERDRELLAIIKTKYQLGKVARVEVLQAEQTLLAGEQQLIDLENSLASSEETLRNLLNATPDTPLVFDQKDLLKLRSVPVNLDVPLAALAARPDIQAAEARFQSAFKSMESEKAGWYPTLTIGSTLGATSDTASRYFDIPFLSGTVKVAFPFLDWNRVRFNIKISEADYETARLDFTKTVITALNEVQAAYIASQKSAQSLEKTREKYDKDVQVSAYYRDRYELGSAELKDYLDAVNTEDSSLLEVLQAKYSLLASENQVYQAMGGRYSKKER